MLSDARETRPTRVGVLQKRMLEAMPTDLATLIDIAETRKSPELTVAQGRKQGLRALAALVARGFVVEEKGVYRTRGPRAGPVHGEREHGEGGAGGGVPVRGG